MDNESSSLKGRSSVFTEIGLEGHDPILDEKIRSKRPRLPVRFRSNVSIVEPTIYTSNSGSDIPIHVAPSRVPTSSRVSLLSHMSFSQYFLLLAIVALAFPTFLGSETNSNMVPAMAEAGAVLHTTDAAADAVTRRQDASTDVCKRWAGQSALVNGTLFYYGGRATTSSDQSTNEWSK